MGWDASWQAHLPKIRLRYINKMYKFFKKFTLFFIIILFSNPIYSQENNLQKKWNIKKLIYSDNSELKLDNGNFIIIDKNSISEVMSEYGNRRYPYYKKSNILYLKSGGSEVEWKILFIDDNSLTLETPIGTYVLEE